MHMIAENQKKANCIFVDFSYTRNMKKIAVRSSEIHVIESSYIIDDGSVWHVDIVIAPGIEVEYCLVPMTWSLEGTPTYTRQIHIGAGTVFHGSGICMHSASCQITTDIVGDNVVSTLDILTLVLDGVDISVEWVAKVDAPYRHISTRVDQTNILIGTGGRVRGVPRLEIATDDIEGGHSCKMHRLWGDVLFYLQSRGLSSSNAESLLLNSEILKHLSPVSDEDRHEVCYQIHQALKAE